MDSIWIVGLLGQAIILDVSNKIPLLGTFSSCQLDTMIIFILFFAGSMVSKSENKNKFNVFSETVVCMTK